MKIQLSRSVALATANAAAALLVTPALSAQDLGRAMPKDVQVYVRAATGAQQDPAWSGFVAACKEAGERGIVQDLIDFACIEMSRRKAQQTRAGAEQFFTHVAKVDWSSLFAEEFIFAERLTVPMPEYFFAFRTPQGSGPQHLAAFKDMLSGFAEMSQGTATVRDIEKSTGTIVSMSVDGAPIQIAVGATDNALVLTTGVSSTSAALRRLSTPDATGSVIDTDRFVEAMAPLGATQSSTSSFTDMDAIMSFLGSVLGMAEVGLAAGGEVSSQAEQTLGVARVLLEELDVIETITSVANAEGPQGGTGHTVIQMRDDADSMPVVQLFSNQQAWTDWKSMVPANATAFSFESGFNIGAALEWVAEVADESTDLSVQAWWETRQFRDLRRIGSHLSGEVASVSFPCAGAEGCKLGEGVTWLRLEKTEGVDRWIQAVLGAAVNHVRSRGQDIELHSVDGMHELRIAALPWIRPTVGVRDGMVTIATSRSAIAAIDKVRSGAAAGIASHERFAALGLDGGDGSAVYYSQLDDTDGAVGDLMGAMGFFLSVVPPEQRDTRAPIKLGQILTKLAPILRAADIGFDTATVSTMDNKTGAMHIRSVNRYR